MPNTETKFDSWCIVELFGHQKIAGYCTEQNVAGTNMLRVDVPETATQPAFSKFFGSGAIYAINPVDEKTARMAVDKLEIAPVTVWHGETFTKKYLESKTSLPPADAADDDIHDIDMEDDEEDDFR